MSNKKQKYLKKISFKTKFVYNVGQYSNILIFLYTFQSY